MPTEKSIIKDISFFSDGFKLKGYLHLPTTGRPPVVIGCHGLHSSSNSPKQIALADQCNRLGIAYFRFDHRGCGGSEGKFEAVTSLEARCRDLADAVAVITGTSYTGDRFGLFGSSMGGTVCLSIAAEIDAAAIVTFAAPLRSRTHEQPLKQPDNTSCGKIYLDAHKSDFDISVKIPQISNILIIHGEADETVPLSHAEEIHRLAGEPKKLVVQPCGDHRMSNAQHQHDFIREASGWFQSGLCDI